MSGASVSSLGSAGGSSIASFNPKGELAPGEEDGFEEPHSIQQGCFGVLYTVCKEQYLTSIKFTLFRLLLDFLQLWLLVVNPAYGFDIAADSGAWKAVSFIQLNWILSERGYMFFLVVLYIFIALLAANVGLSVWVAHQFSNNRFDHVWPIVFLRWFGLIFYQVLDVATLTLLLGTLDCQYFGVPKKLQFYNQLFPEVYCWSMPHLVHVAVSVVSILVFLVMAGAMVVSQMDLNPLTRNYMGIMHTRTEGYSFLIKTIATIASVMISDVKWLSITYLVCFLALTYLHTKWVPFTFSGPNYVHGGGYFIVLYSSLLLVALAFASPSDPVDKEKFSRNITIAVWAGMAPAALLGALATHLRLRAFRKTVAQKFKTAERGINPKYIFRFTDAREVELTLRHCRQWLDEDTPEPEFVDLGEQLVKAGMMQLPQDSLMTILYSSFLIDVQGSYQSGYTQLQAAKKKTPGILERFAIFSREQEHTQKASGVNGGAGTAVDLVSYVEFQRSHRLVTRAHKEALMAMRAFWGLLMHSSVNFIKLTKAMNRIEVTVRAAERAYRNVLTRHSNNARLVRLYGRFLESVKFDPWAASKWFSEAERLEERDEHAKEAMQLGGTGIDMGGAGGVTEGLAILFINSQGTIQVASPEAAVLLGYQKNELKGKDVGVIMPPPFGDRHNAYLRNYIHSAVSTILDKHNDFVVLSKSRSVVPVRIRVSKVSGMSEDSVFMGTLEALPSPPGFARAWLLGGGAGSTGSSSTLIAADDRFYDWLGYEQVDLVGQPMDTIVADTELVGSAITYLWSLKSAPTKHVAQRRRRSSMAGITTSDALKSLGLGQDRMDADKSHHMGHGQNQHHHPEKTPSATLAALEWRHKYSGPVPFTTVLTPGTFGSVHYMTVTLHADWHLSVPRPGGLGLPSAISELMLVSDHKGRLLHVTAALAQALGRTMESIRAGGMEMLLPEPYSSLHGPWMQALAAAPGQAVAGTLDCSSTPPPHSCRTGVAVSLCAYDEAEGPVTLPFRLRLQQRLMQKGASRVHVVSLEKLAREQVLSERRLRLMVDLSGTITSVDAASIKLFGMDPRVVVGKALGELVDLFSVDDALRDINVATGGLQQGGNDGVTTGMDDLLVGVAGVFNAARSRQTTKQLLELARRSAGAEGVSWRVGVTLPADPELGAQLEQLTHSIGPLQMATASKLIGGKVVPAVMRVRLVKRPAVGSTAPHSDARHLLGDDFSNSKKVIEPSETPKAKWVINWKDVGRSSLSSMPPPPMSPLPPAPPPPPPLLVDGHAAKEALDASPLPSLAMPHLSTPGSLILAEDMHRPSSLRLAAPPDLRRTATNASISRLPSTLGTLGPGGLATRAALMSDGDGDGSTSRPQSAAVFAKHSSQLYETDPFRPHPVTNSTSLAPSGLYLEVELWRADLLSGVLEVDERGRVLRIDPTDSLGQAGLVLGASKVELAGCAINSLLPLPSGGAAALFTTSSGDGGAPGRLRGALKSNRKDSRSKTASQPTTLVGCHMGDGCAFSVCVQAVRRAGPYGSMYLIIRPHEPAPVQEGFMRWLADEGDVSGLARRTQLGYRDTAQGYRDTALGVTSSEEVTGNTAKVIISSLTAFAAGPALRTPSMLREDILNGPAAAGEDNGGLAMPVSAAAVPSLPPPLPPQLQLGGGLDNLRAAPMRSGTGSFAGGGAAPRASRFATGNITGAGPHLQPSQNNLSSEEDAAGQQQKGRVTSMDGGVAGPNPLSGAVQRLLATSQQKTLVSDPVATPLSPRTSASLIDLKSGQQVAAGPDEQLETQGSSVLVQGVTTSNPGGPKSKKEDKLLAISNWVMSGGTEHLGSPAHEHPTMNGLKLPGATMPVAPTSTVDGSDGGHAGPRGDSSSNSQEGDCLSSEEGGDRGGGKKGKHAKVAEGAGDDGGGMVEKSKGSASGGRSAGDGDSGADMEDEAGAHVTNYGAGKRFKKIYRLLMSPQAQRASHMLWVKSAIVVALLMAAHTATFVLLLTRLQLQQANIVELNSMGDAAIRLHEIALRCRTMAELFRGASMGNGTDKPAVLAEGVPLFGDPYEESVQFLLEDMHEGITDMKELQHGIYLGFTEARRIPVDYGLRDIWDLPRINVTKYFDANDESGKIVATLPPVTIIPHSDDSEDAKVQAVSGNVVAVPDNLAGSPLSVTTLVLHTSVNMRIGLWEAGNMFISQALDVRQNAVPLVERGVSFDTWSSNMFVQTNALEILWPPYMESLDAETQITVQKGRSVYNLQLVMLCMEGGALCILACTFMWFSTGKFVGTRYSLYSVFVHLPMGLTRGLANMSIQLEPGEEEDDDPTLPQNGGEDTAAPAAGDSAAANNTNGGGGVGNKSARLDSTTYGSGGADKKGAMTASMSAAVRRISMAGLPAAEESKAAATGSNGVGSTSVRNAADAAAAVSGSGGLFGMLQFWKHSNKVQPGGPSGPKRRLVPSRRIAALMVLPFLLWGVVVLTVNLAGFAALYGNDGPIASLGVMHTVIVRFHRVLYYSMDLAASLVNNPVAVEGIKTVLKQELADARLEYSVLLYGAEALEWVNYNTTHLEHLKLAPKGILFFGGKTSEVLFRTSGCMCTLPEDCQEEDSPYYEVTRNGLDVLFKAALLAVESLINQDSLNPSGGLNSSEFRMLWSTFETDMEGGVDSLAQLYLAEVQRAYENVRTQQVILFVIAWVWAIIFLALQLRPFLRRAHLEMRRIAELLSQLPPEVDVETMVARVVLVNTGHSIPVGATTKSHPSLLSMKSVRM